MALEKKIEKLFIHSKKNIQIVKANQVANKKNETMADRIAAIVAINGRPTNAIKIAIAPSNPRPSSNPIKVANLKKTGLYIIIDLAKCKVSLHE